MVSGLKFNGLFFCCRNELWTMWWFLSIHQQRPPTVNINDKPKRSDYFLLPTFFYQFLLMLFCNYCSFSVFIVHISYHWWKIFNYTISSCRTKVMYTWLYTEHERVCVSTHPMLIQLALRFYPPLSLYVSWEIFLILRQHTTV